MNGTMKNVMVQDSFFEPVYDDLDQAVINSFGKQTVQVGYLIARSGMPGFKQTAPVEIQTIEKNYGPDKDHVVKTRRITRYLYKGIVQDHY